MVLKTIVKSDIEIAQDSEMRPIVEIAEKIGLEADDLELFGKYKAKISNEALAKLRTKESGKIILVTSINPTPAGEGKSTVTVGLADAFNKIGKKTMIAIREPSWALQWVLKAGRLVVGTHKSCQWKISIYTLLEIFTR